MLPGSGVHGAICVLEPSFSGGKLAGHFCCFYMIYNYFALTTLLVTETLAAGI